MFFKLHAYINISHTNCINCWTTHANFLRSFKLMITYQNFLSDVLTGGTRIWAICPTAAIQVMLETLSSVLSESGFLCFSPTALALCTALSLSCCLLFGQSWKCPDCSHWQHFWFLNLGDFLNLPINAESSCPPDHMHHGERYFLCHTCLVLGYFSTILANLRHPYYPLQKDLKRYKINSLMGIWHMQVAPFPRGTNWNTSAQMETESQRRTFSWLC